MKITESLGANKKKANWDSNLNYISFHVSAIEKNNQTETKSGKGHGLKPTFLGSTFVGWINQYLLRYETNFDILWLVKPPIYWTEKTLFLKNAAAPHTFQLPRQALKIGWVDKKVSEPKITKCRLARDLAADGSVPCSWL